MASREPSAAHAHRWRFRDDVPVLDVWQLGIKTYECAECGALGESDPFTGEVGEKARDAAPAHDERPSIVWTKVALIGCPGSECGRELRDGGETVENESFKAEFGPCDEPGRWLVGMLFVCQKHAAMVAYEFGDDIDEIERAWKERL